MSASDPNQPVHSDYDEKMSVVREHAAAAAREKPDPEMGSEPASLWSFFFAGLALVVGAGYLGATNGGFSNGSFTYVESYVVPKNPEAGEDGGPPKSPGEVWLAEGRKYFTTCANCHKQNGLGQAGVPPLAGSEWVTQGSERLAMVILNGMHGPVRVAGSVYNGTMPAHKSVLNDKKLAQVMSFIRTSWGNEADHGQGDNGLVSEEMVAYARKTHDLPSLTVDQLAGFDKNLPGPQLDPETLEPIGAGGAQAPEAEEGADEKL